MRALTLWQPWAQYIVTGEKRVETRGWPTKIRGEIAVHAAKRKPDKTIRFADLPLGAIVGTVEIMDCVPIEELYGSQYDTPLERSYGDWAQGRYGWILRNPKRFEMPIAATGHQGFWQWDQERTTMHHDSSTLGWNRNSKYWCDAIAADAIEGRTTMDPGVLFIDRLFGWMGGIAGKQILDLGCGEGRHARGLARLGAQVTAIDCAAFSIATAEKKAREEGLDIAHHVRNSNDLYGIDDSSFDIVLCTMMLMDCADLQGTVREVARVLKPSGRLFASVLHPCFSVSGKDREGIGRMDSGIDRKVVVKNYFDPTQWEEPLFEGGVPVVWHHRTLQDYVKAFGACGLAVVDLNEPVPTEEQAALAENIAWLRKIPIFLFMEMQKQACLRPHRGTLREPI
ncbi:MAG: methyltransferase domain-containing protein [Oscillospiraceae bacterium]|jgi:2-polyprenyl-3-methyl-5-hydroxy-6-metoxy-1,4-benzoquinol methylase|nr:methyltransferase domain-containing protein [Oscillospiraceae bacterium]